MAAAYRTSVSGGVADSGATTQDSASLTTVSGDVLYAIVANSDGSPAEPTSVVFDSGGVAEAFTKVKAFANYGTYYGASLWRLVGPTAKSAAIRATWSGNQGERLIIVAAYSGVDATTPNGTIVETLKTGQFTPASATATTTAGQLVAAFAALASGGSQQSFDSPSGTERAEASTSGTPYDTAAVQDQTASGSSTTPSNTVIANVTANTMIVRLRASVRLGQCTLRSSARVSLK